VSGATGEESLAVLQRWEGSGGTWRLVSQDGNGVVLELLTCSGGEVMGHLRSDDPTVLAHVLRAEQP
jgi:hypothetical protein